MIHSHDFDGDLVLPQLPIDPSGEMSTSKGSPATILRDDVRSIGLAAGMTHL